jgi:hypothetical protein
VPVIGSELIGTAPTLKQSEFKCNKKIVVFFVNPANPDKFLPASSLGGAEALGPKLAAEGTDWITLSFAVPALTIQQAKYRQAPGWRKTE